MSIPGGEWADLPTALGNLNRPMAPLHRRVVSFLRWEGELFGRTQQDSTPLDPELGEPYTFAEVIGLNLRLVHCLPQILFPYNRWALRRGEEARRTAYKDFGILFSAQTPSVFLREVYLDHIYTDCEKVTSAFKGIVVDVGAQFGDFALLCAKGFDAKRVVAFEAVPWVFDVLCENVSLNGCENISPIRAFVSDTDKASPQLENASTKERGKSLDLPEVRTLDSFRFEGVTLLKIDVEGSELRVLRGSRKLLRKDRPIVVLETHSLRLGRAVESFLTDEGYRRLHEQDLLVYPVPGFDQCKNVFYVPRTHDISNTPATRFT